MKKLFFLSLLLFSLPAHAKEFEFHGYFLALGRIYPGDDLSFVINENVDLEAILEFDYQPTEQLRFFLTPRILIDPTQSARNRYDALEGFVEWIENRWDLRAGQMIESWAIVDTFNPVDVLNRRDPQRNFYDPDKLGEIMIRGRTFFPGNNHFSDIILSAYFLPLLRETPLPANNDRFRFSPTGGLGILDTDATHTPSDYVDRMSYALRLSTVFKGADFFMAYYGGPSRIPSFLLNPTTNLLDPVYYRVDLLGGGAQYAWDAFLFKTELAYTWTQNNGLSFPFTPLVPDPYFQYVVGFDYTLKANFLGKTDLTLTLEYAGEDELVSNLQGLRPFKNDLFMGFAFALNDPQQTRLTYSATVDLGHGETLMQIEFERKIWKELKAYIEGFVMIPEEGTFSPLGVFGNNSSIAMGISWAF